MDTAVQTSAIRDERGRFIKPPPNAAPPLPSATARDMVQKRKDKAARLLRSRIAEATRDVSTLDIRDGADAVAEAGAMIWRETVLSQDVYPRDRLQAWETIGKHAGVLSDNRAQAGQAVQVDGVGRVNAVAVLLAVVGSGNSNYRKHDEVLDVEAVEVEGEGVGGDG